MAYCVFLGDGCCVTVVDTNSHLLSLRSCPSHLLRDTLSSQVPLPPCSWPLPFSLRCPFCQMLIKHPRMRCWDDVACHFTHSQFHQVVFHITALLFLPPRSLRLFFKSLFELFIFFLYLSLLPLSHTILYKSDKSHKPYVLSSSETSILLP